jgi:nicotinamide phosphoribosyltransferase
VSAVHLPFPLRSDSYKLTHWRQYPAGTTEVYSYFESRGGAFLETVFFGLQYYLRAYLAGCVVRSDEIVAADRFAQGHFGRPGLFHREGWLHIVRDHAGRLPVEIRAVAEGTAIPAHNVLMTIRNTCPRCFWLTNFLETMLVKVWYPSTVCTLSREIHETLLQALAHTGEDLALADSMLHDFGYRGTSSEESAAIGGAAHLVHFRTSDTLAANFLLREHYAVGDPDWIPSTSVPAAEHSTITAWGREHEVDAYRAMLSAYPTGVVSIVADSYDIFRAAREIFGGVLRADVLARDGVLVLRPDSGDPKAVLSALLPILADRFGSQLNQAGYRRLHPRIRLLWGDGIDLESLRQISLTSRPRAGRQRTSSLGWEAGSCKRSIAVSSALPSSAHLSPWTAPNAPSGRIRSPTAASLPRPESSP